MNNAKPCELYLTKIKMYAKYLNGSQTTVISLLKTALIMTQMWGGLVSPGKLFSKKKKKYRFMLTGNSIRNECN